MMKILFVRLFSFLLLLTPALAQANEQAIYTVAGVGYATNKIGNNTHDELAYKLNIGYVFSSQWALELGFQVLGNSDLSNTDLLNNIPNMDSNYEVNAFNVSALGKAGNQWGELFYRIGVAQVNTQSTFVNAALTCSTGSELVLMEQGSLLCNSENDQIAGIIGIGFDFNISNTIKLRTEFEHIQGSDNYSAQAITLGLRANF